MNSQRQYVLSIAGFDPSGGAGVLADIKTFEKLHLYGLGSITANTLQDDTRMIRVDWMPLVTILEQIDIVLNRFEVNFFKIGIVKNKEYLTAIIDRLIQKRPLAFIVWDPVFKSSSGAEIFEDNVFPDSALSHISLITPNLPEFNFLFQSRGRALAISYRTMVYLKGGHCLEHPGRDYLFLKGTQRVFDPGEIVHTPKHGSGCVLSSALCAHLALGNSIEEACRKSKQYMETFLSSDPGLLGWHNL